MWNVVKMKVMRYVPWNDGDDGGGDEDDDDNDYENDDEYDYGEYDNDGMMMTINNTSLTETHVSVLIIWLHLYILCNKKKCQIISTTVHKANFEKNKELDKEIQQIHSIN